MPDLKEKLKSVRNVREKLKVFRLSRLIPNIVTLASLCSGVTSLRFSLEGRYEIAMLFILIAALLDGLDGRLARFLGQESRFGAELDSLADFVNFGISPSLMIYLHSLKSLDSFGWGAVLIYVVCAALRLARFNVISIEEEHCPEKKLLPTGFFLGVPITISGFLVLMPLFLYVNKDFQFHTPPVITMMWMLLISFLMISRLFIFSFKKMYIPKTAILPILIGVVVIITLMLEFPWITLFGIGFIYVACIPMSHKKGRLLSNDSKKLG